ncbi:class I SAM-dependent methyltransferase [Blastopirellula marina]|uniref:SAM-dependent methyltransferase n=1 Tax=Blastopirellula marina TaxID=124 RepID=A0A2S8GBB1_9BACT|nr:class I SAM-dependent methyltransferase [Blastopirellula marina]PQO41746.1 SAM-dependent methyltransferase [Blastopirellula marina]PTL46189.1 class I SAM-dependent methyltransferase [Blastopirellula marina]
MPRISIFSLLLVLLLTVLVQAQEGVVVKKGLPFYKGREIAQTMHYRGAPWLIRESRQREEDCQKMLENLGVKPGMTICDMGCGNGFYSLQLAEMVGKEGKILAVDIQSEMLRLLKARAEEQGIDNIELILGDIDNPKLPEGKVDLVMCVDVYHEFSHPEEMLAGMRKALKPDGMIVLLEFRMEDPKVPIKRLHKMSKKQILKEYKANGFQLAKEYDDLPWQHMMFFEKTKEEK